MFEDFKTKVNHVIFIENGLVKKLRQELKHTEKRPQVVFKRFIDQVNSGSFRSAVSVSPARHMQPRPTQVALETRSVISPGLTRRK